MGELLVLIAIGVLFFGAKRIPAALGSVFATKKAFRKGLEGDDEEDERPQREVKEILPPDSKLSDSKKEPRN